MKVYACCKTLSNHIQIQKGLFKNYNLGHNILELSNVSTDPINRK